MIRQFFAPGNMVRLFSNGHRTANGLPTRYHGLMVPLLALFLLSLPGFAQDIPAEDSLARDLPHRRKKVSFIPLPILYYAPETRIGTGVIGVCLFQADSVTRTSNVDFAVIFTQRHQLIVDPIYTIFTKGEKCFIRGNLLYTRFPEYFYGVGNETPASLKEDIAYKTFQVTNRVLRKIRPYTFVGIQQQYYRVFDVEHAPNTHHPPGSFEGYNGSVSSGVGLAAVYDSRDNILNPYRGMYAEFSNFFYRSAFGSELAFTTFFFDFRKYIRLTPKSLLALQMVGNFNAGHVPFKQLATIGGARLLRGYYNGRYRDKDLLALQAEYRRHLIGRFGFTLFGDMGEVAYKLSRFDWSHTRYTYGGGLRYMVQKHERLNIRLDVGFGEHVRGLYINLSEAF